MRPILLSIKAFGPFADEQIIDFSLLHDRPLFLIHGPTGAGKTSILDALCFALYGVPSVSDRSILTLRSHHADPSLQTEITLTFSIGTITYRVTRIPEQDRPKTRGSGITRKVASALLEQQTGTAENAHWNSIADKWNRVSEKIETLLGFRSDQFRQVVLLPQGEFRQFLSSSSQERQQILATLFKTGRYQQIEETLKNRAKTIYNEFDTLKKQLLMILDDCSCESIDILAEKINASESLCSELELKREQLALKERNCQRLYNDALSVNEKFSTLASVEYEYSILETQKAGIDQMVLALTRYEHALAVETTYELNSSARKELLSIQNRYTEALEALKIARNKLQEAENECTQVPTIEHLREELRSRLEYLNLLLPKLQEYTVVAQHYSEQTKTHEKLKHELQQGKDHLENVKNALKKCNEQAVMLHDEASRLGSLSSEYSIIEQHCLLEKRKTELQQHIADSSNCLRDAEHDYASSCGIVDTSKETLEQLGQLVYEGRAALLATTLRDNVPCPVCGSLHHPYPAHSNTILPDEKKVKQLKEELKRRETERDQKKKLLEQMERTLAEYSKELSILKDQSGAGNDNLIPDELDKKLEEVRLLVKKASNAESQLKTVRDHIQRGETALMAAEQEVTTLTERYTESVSLFSSAETRLHALEKEIPVLLRDMTALSDEKSQINNTIGEYDKKIRMFRSTLEETGKKAASLNASTDMLYQQMTDKKSQLETVVIKFTNDLHEHEFADESDFLTYLRSTTEIAAIRQKIHDFSLAHHAAQDRKDRAFQACEGLHCPDLTLLEKQLASVRNELEAIVKTCAAEQHQKNRFIERFRECETLKNKIAQCESDYAVTGHLAEVASGDNPLRITFERFILSTLLDDVLYAGTQRLSVMSRNRYTFHRARVHTDQRTAGGLDLMVFDTYTGTSRPVNSLSGGESFLAALSLALGLADVVQSYSGGIHLDTLFIDEGFGSLDAESLDCAFEALSRLGRDGRLVGIISHVSELRERMGATIELHSGRHGSTVSVKV